MLRSNVFNRLLLFIVLTVFLAMGCSSGGGGNSASSSDKVISGVAAAGAPVIGTVTLKDSNGTQKVVEIEADGNYTVDVSDLTPPFAFRADGFVGGKEYHLYSAAVEADINGTINITPFTSLIIANIARQIAGNYFESGDYSNLTPAELTAAESELQAKLQPILTALGVDTAIDLLRTSFATDHTGIDAVIDVIKVTVDPETVKATLTDITNNEEIEVDISNGGTSTADFSGDGTLAGATALQSIVARMDALTASFKVGLPDPDNTSLRSIFNANTFMHDGANLDTFLSELTSDSSVIGISFTNIAVDSINLTEGTCEFSFAVMKGGIASYDPETGWKAVKSGNSWYIQGNRRIAFVNIGPKAMMSRWPNVPQIEMATGINLYIEANQPAGSSVQSAVVTGPGLPDTGAVLNKNASRDWFTLSGYTDQNFYSIDSDTVIADIPENAVYTTTLFDSVNGQGNIVATYTSTTRKGPMKNSAISGSNFPTITSPATFTLAPFTAGSMVLTWTLPTGLRPDKMKLIAENQAGTEAAVFETDPAIGDTSATLAFDGLNFTVATAHLHFSAEDSHGRIFETGIYW